MPTAVVTGGAGFLGSHLCDYLIAMDYRVVCVDNLDTGSLQNIEHLRGDDFLFINHDVTQPPGVDEPIDSSTTSRPWPARSTTCAFPCTR